MNPENQRIAIAESVGWQWHGDISWTKKGDDPYWKLKDGPAYRLLPDYLNDLNATMDVARHLAKSGWRCAANMGTDGSWECFFTKRASSGDIPTEGDHYGAGDTLAKALAEAYLRAIGKWKD